MMRSINVAAAYAEAGVDVVEFGDDAWPAGSPSS